MITLTVEKDWTGKYTFIVSNGFDSQSFTPGTVVAVLGGVMIAYAVINIVQSIMFMKNSKIIVVEKVD